jgi:hypothetical protein
MKGNKGDDGHRGEDVGDGYKAFSQTMSGWEISVNDDAPIERRWRAIHKQFGTKYFDNHDEILEHAVQLVAVHAEHLRKHAPEKFDELVRQSDVLKRRLLEEMGLK